MDSLRRGGLDRLRKRKSFENIPVIDEGRHRLKALNPILQLAMPDAFPSWGEHPEDCQNSWESHQPSTCRVTRVRDERA